MFTRAAHHAQRRGARAAGRVLLCSGPVLLTYKWCAPATLRTESIRDRLWSSPAPGRDLKAGEANASKSSRADGGASKEQGLDGAPSESESAWSWQAFSQRFSLAGDSVQSVEWSSLGDRITGYLVPEWAQSIPGQVRKLQAEMGSQPGSLREEIALESNDPEINPEITRTAEVRLGTGLCSEELAFREARRKHTTKALARYLGIREADIHPDDVPVIAMCGSGGGLRALVAGASSYHCAQQAGLLDCATYTAGVSGSCWLQTLYHSSLAQHDFGRLLRHLKKRLGVHIAFPPPALNMLATAPTNKFLLSGLLEKAAADPRADFGLVDVYGLLLAARLLVPRAELEVDAADLKLSNQRRATDDGSHPLPIYCAVRHEIPPQEAAGAEHAGAQQQPSSGREPWFQWFEWTPYEFWCEELDAGIPTWSLGRIFDGGRSVPRDSGWSLPEMRVPQLLGIWGSAFCATLSHYYKEIRPAALGLAGFGGIDDLIAERDADLVKVHPIDPATIPNFARGLPASAFPPDAPASVREAEHLQLMDAGMSNNLPIYPLLRPGREVDVLVAFDASADIREENWLAVADGYARRRGIAGWPMGTGWPQPEASREQTARELEAAQPASPEDAARKTQDALRSGAGDQPRDLGPCTVWVGAAEQEAQHAEPRADAGPRGSRRIDADAPEDSWEFVAAEGADPGLAVVYFPLVANEAVPGVDPQTDAFMSTWNFVYTPDDVDAVARLARANWEAGADQTRRCVRAVYERKRRLRLLADERDREARFREGIIHHA